MPTPTTQGDPINWADLLGRAFLAGALHLLGHAIREEMKASQEAPADNVPDADVDEVQEAATLLGVSVDAGEDEIRAALRARLASSRLHPDQGGDGEEAKRLIAAKNLLVERQRLVRP
jgi:hypothetical protein